MPRQTNNRRNPPVSNRHIENPTEDELAQHDEQMAMMDWGRFTRCFYSSPKTHRNRFRRFVQRTKRVIEQGHLPNSQNTGFETCSRNGEWKIVIDPETLNVSGDYDMFICGKCRDKIVKSIHIVGDRITTSYFRIMELNPSIRTIQSFVEMLQFRTQRDGKSVFDTLDDIIRELESSSSS